MTRSRLLAGALAVAAVATATTAALASAGSPSEAPRAGTAPAVRPVAAAPVAASARMSSTPISFRIGSFNVLGSWHTRAGHDASAFAPGPMRGHLAAEVIRAYHPQLVGLQEIEPDQVPVVASELPQYTFWPGNSLDWPGVRNTMGFDSRRFTMTANGYLTQTFLSQTRYVPFIRLQDKATGRQFWWMNTHNSPNRGGTQTYADERRVQLAQEASKVRQLEATGLPVLLTGDMNDKQTTYCTLVSNTMLHAAQGFPGGCTMPTGSHIEWIFGTRGRVTWSGYKYVYGSLISSTTDHHVPWVTATLP